MSDHSQWKATKAKAVKENNKKPIKFPKDMKFGAALDKVDATRKVYEKAGEKERDAAWAKAADAYFAAVAAANKAALTYQQALDGMELTPEAASTLDAELTMNYMRNLSKISKDGKRIEAQLAKARKTK